VSLVLGGCLLLSSWLGDNPRDGVWMFGVMAAVGLIFLLSGRSETMRMMRGDQKDERWTLIDLRATAIAGHVVIGYAIGGFMYELANGRDGSPYGLMGAAAGLAYLVALVGLRLRA
jgi:hypothetical protein